MHKRKAAREKKEIDEPKLVVAPNESAELIDACFYHSKAVTYLYTLFLGDLLIGVVLYHNIHHFVFRHKPVRISTPFLAEGVITVQ